MLSILATIFLGWPAILASVFLTVLGLLRYNYRLIVAGAVTAFPFSWFLSGFPVVRSPLFLIPVFVFAAAFAQFRGRDMLAWLLAIPFFLMVLLLFFVVVGQ